MSYLGTRNAVALGVSQHMTLGGSNLLETLSPSLLLQFVGAESLDPRITFTRASTATFTGLDGLIQTAAIDAPRFDYNPTTLASLGLLIEEQRTNAFTFSEQFDNAAWTKTNSSITADATTSPDGTTDADKIVSNAGSLGLVVQSNSQTSGVTYTWSTFAKAAEYSFCQLRITGTVVGSITRAYFNLATGTVSVATNCTASITPVGDGWYRCSLVYLVTSTATASPRIYGQVDTVDTVGDGTSGIYIWGAQLEAGAFPTSYIPTVASQVTRAADVAVMTGTNFSDWYNASEGALFCEGSREYLAVTAGLIQIDDGTSSNRMAFQTTNTAKMRVFIVSGGVTQTSLDSAASLISNVVFKTALGYATNDVSGALNGVSLATDTSATIPTVSTMRIGQGLTTLGACRIQRIAYFPRRLANSELQAITA
jgi:hypothetical protein